MDRSDLTLAGATSVMVVNLPNIGLTPRQNGDPVAAAQGDFISVQFNAVQQAVDGATAALTAAGVDSSLVVHGLIHGLEI